MMNVKVLKYNIPFGIEAVRADKLLASVFNDISRVRIQKAFISKKVKLNGVVIGKSYKIKETGHISLELEKVVDPKIIKPNPIKLNIIYEDDDIIVVNKPSGMVTHPGNATKDDTLVHALLAHCNGSLSSVGLPLRPGIVHRLDKYTSGIIVSAKTDLAHQKLVNYFSEREVKKYYKALIMGVPELEFGIIKNQIGRHVVNRKKMAINNKGKEAHTEWKILDKYRSIASLVQCRIYTGRTHQIRVHMSNMGFPIIGDKVYGFKESKFKEIKVNRTYLHANRMEITHPISLKKMIFDCALPGDFNEMINALKVRS